MRCSVCGFEVTPGSKFCMKCGTPMQSVEQNPAQSDDEATILLRRPQENPGADNSIPGMASPVNSPMSGNGMSGMGSPANGNGMSGMGGPMGGNGMSGMGSPMGGNGMSGMGSPMGGNGMPGMGGPMGGMPVIPEEYRPIGVLGYVGYQILFAIPLVGFIMVILFACGISKNKNVKNFARSYLVVLLIVIILCVIAYFAFGALFAELIAQLG